MKFLRRRSRASIAAGLTIAMLARVYQFGDAAPGDTREVLAAPQASIMKALVEGFMNRQPVAYFLFGAGAAIAIMLEMLRGPRADVRARHVPAARAEHPRRSWAAHLALRRRRSPRRRAAKRGARCASAAVVIASGLMAGGALGGVFGAALRIPSWYREDLIKTPFYGNEAVSQGVSMVFFIGLCLYLWIDSTRRVGER